MPLVPRTARTIDLAVGERHEGSILRRRDGHRLDRRPAHRWVRSIGKRAGLGAVHPHMMRAAFITAALDAGVPLRDVQIAAPVTPTPGPRPSTTGDARTSTATPPTWSSPSWPAAEPRLTDPTRHFEEGVGDRIARALPVWVCPSRPSWRGAPGRRRWSRWSARSAARTYDLDLPEGRCRLGVGPADGGVGAPCVTWVLDERDVVGDNNRDLGVPRGVGSAVASVL